MQNYLKELSPLDSINPKEIKMETNINYLEILSKQISQLSCDVINEIKQAVLKGESMVDVLVDGYNNETRKIVTQYLKQRWKARIYSPNIDGSSINTWIRVKW